MQIFKNVLSDSLLSSINTEIKDLINKSVWISSLMVWPKDTLKNVVGDCSITLVGPKICVHLVEELKDKLPHCNKMVFQYYIWKQNSAISLHDDGLERYGATIYLNEKWDMDLGGIFLWKTESEIKGFCPEYNSMVLNTVREPHLVTPVNPLSLEHRYTIQIWGY